MEEVMRKMEEAEYSFYSYNGMTMSSVFPADILNKIKQTVFNDDDIIVATYPKCGKK